MRIAKVRLTNGEERLAIWQADDALQLLKSDGNRTLSELLYSDDPVSLATSLIEKSAEPIKSSSVKFLAPIDQQEVWAAGVTYKRSQVARMQESESAATHYDKVYTAARPELFFKATPNRVRGPGEPLRIRVDTKWSVPEPEFALIVRSDLKLVGYTIGNDMSARDIEGENPLYLPQAKLYSDCCGLGPCAWIPETPIDRAATKIRLSIQRGGTEVFSGTTDLDHMKRTFEDLVSWLGKDNEFPNGAILLTGTGIVPPDDFTLQKGDLVEIEVNGIGTLTNTIVQG
ncbi:MAG: fumarylacetoacetate hydrolase family protein [Planctomycetaceae bacterium]|nr:fumarylacetoacetate hydrolase family protein [Planctomycetaceae bacterium]